MVAPAGRGRRLLSIVFTFCFLSVSFVSGLSFDENMTTLSEGMVPEPTAKYAPGQANGTIEIKVSAASPSFTYDANGNLVSGHGFTYVYDDANHLSEVRSASDNSLVAQYFYDDAGNRIKKVSGGVTTYYVGNYVETRVVGAQREDTSYYFANTERVARKDPDGKKYYYHGDHIGSTSIVTNATGGVVESVAYLPYGETQSKSGGGSTFLYTDQELDPETGLYYYGARYYSPEMMRFVEPDSFIQNMYNPQNLNRYSYVLNNPMKYTDPTGNFIPLIVVAAIIIVAGVSAEVSYLQTHHTDPSNLQDGAAVVTEGFVAGTIAFVSTMVGEAVGAAAVPAQAVAKSGILANVGQTVISSFSSQVTENVISGNPAFEDTPTAVFAGATSEVLVDSLPTKIKGKMAKDTQELLKWGIGEVTTRGINYITDNSRSNNPSVASSAGIGVGKGVAGSAAGIMKSSLNKMTSVPSGSSTSYSDYSPAQALVDTINPSTGGGSTKPTYGYNPHKYPWDSSPLKGWG